MPLGPRTRETVETAADAPEDPMRPEGAARLAPINPRGSTEHLPGARQLAWDCPASR